MLTALALSMPVAAAKADPIRYELQSTSTVLVDGATSLLSGFLALEPRSRICTTSEPDCPFDIFAVIDIQLSGGGLELSRGMISGPEVTIWPASIRVDEGSVYANVLLESSLIAEGIDSPGVAYREWRQLALTAHVFADGSGSSFLYSFPGSRLPSGMILFLDLEEQTLRHAYDVTPDDGFAYIGGYSLTTSYVLALATVRAAEAPEASAALSLIVGLLALAATRASASQA
jgi:hypothetical protein